MQQPDLSLVPSSLHTLLNKQWERLADVLAENAGLLVGSITKDLLQVVVGSDFVVDQLVKYPQMLSELIEDGVLGRAYQSDEYVKRLAVTIAKIDSEAAMMSLLRRFRQKEMVRLIWRDLTRKAAMVDTTRELSWLADAMIDGTLRLLYEQGCERWGTPYGISAESSQKEQQRMVVLGMGKLGANELNLSSDIDLMFCFPMNGETQGARKTLANQDFFIRLGQKLIQALDTLNAEGFVFRVDMRLRPFGSASPLACSFAAMEHYYQDQGRDWERYAMIKARVVAGDVDKGTELLAQLRPFVYRKYIDFSAFESLREMKEMINREVRRKGLEYNVKLGSGGIREVEFIAQAFQLIRGGRDSRLQQRELRNILPLLPELVGMPEQAVEELMDAYTFLRNAEHAIQAVADKQTQELPRDDLGQARLAFSMGFDEWSSFETALTEHRAAVSRHFAEVIAPAQEQGETASQQKTEWLALWSEQLCEEEAIQVITDSGFDEPSRALKLLMDLKASRTVQMLQQTGADRLKIVLPTLLDMIAQADNATVTLARVLQLIQSVLRRSAYLVLLAENPAAMQQLVKLCSSSAWFADQLAKKPVLLDELIDPRTLYSPPDKEQLGAELRQQLLRIPEEDTEQLMEALRYFKSAHLLRVAASDITGVLPLMKVSDYLTWLAEVILESVLDVAWRVMVEKHGRPMKQTGVPCELDFIVVGYGKLGGIELSYGSDLDLVFIHDSDSNLSTDGDKSIANSVFFTRLGQRIIHILNTFTAGGQLYEVDMRLRPSGNSGLLVSSLKAFEEYQQKEAWTWEHQALVRARVVAGSSRLGGEFEQVRASILQQARETAELKTAVVEMREKMRAHLGTSAKEAQAKSVFNLKQDLGGIVDIEFLVQYQVLANAPRYPELYEFTDNIRILDAVEKTKLLPTEDAEALREAYKAYRAAGHRLTLQEQSNVISEGDMKDSRALIARIWGSVMES
ncbi:bifunctional [glutamate--ammonia ligase]-adenylyl-L-tyrosine phosphorylase/[glutamate--ammonia-ligase] adenylyltransferase [Neptunomonas japonica]|uniref:Bifunctional glutamine synthetase adenylyltransferase/adenylyl-removing enzyme n=1 Tax=Neptunomonas japonica JAMM 1380 TaxID=1441457 RepID=A0A7R6SU81_9GAMM|nr:bifunctional [glutamate--ammonia ligase]-adenylyl-L-tyrosine phosphorylase/[glutamate--ammonia-ligase] adenylyltransferase [Neptunomonas japonica]BBB28214.1 glutamate-ammonia-ligase adenylyltransferase [Neptunomonas japonica JAMM 1380]